MENSNLQIIKELAKGGQKEVYLANIADNPFQKVVVKKARISSTSSLQRILREVNFLCGLNSPCFPKNYDSKFDMSTMTITIIEEFIEGETLRNVMKNYKEWDSIKGLLNKLIDALEIIWKRNVVHRDLKPENIIIRSNGEPCIIDFGIARFLDMESITNTLQQMGPCTPLYASPEQLHNDKAAIDLRTDFYALGIIGLELYLQNHPFDPKVVGEGLLYDNLMSSKYAVKTPTKLEDPHVTAFAKHLLQQQPYMRPRTISQLRNLLNTI